jgi:hypothetical protein
MATSGFWHSARRRWYVVLLGVLATTGLVLIAAQVVPTTFRAESNVLLLPPVPPNNPAGNNPYLGLAGYDAFADVVARAMTDTHAVQNLQADGVTDTFDVARDVTTNGPVIVVSVSGQDQRRVLSELGTVVGAIPTVLATLQNDASVPTRYQFTSEAITHPQKASAVHKTQLRAMLVAVVAGLFLTALSVVSSDRLLRRWRRTRSTRAARKADRAEIRAVTDARDDAVHDQSLEEIDLDEELAAATAASSGPRRPPRPLRPAQRRRG